MEIAAYPAQISQAGNFLLAPKILLSLAAQITNFFLLFMHQVFKIITYEIIIVTLWACKNVGTYLESSMHDLQMSPSSYFPNSYAFALMFVGQAYTEVSDMIRTFWVGCCREKCMRILFLKRPLTQATLQTGNLFRVCISDAFCSTLPSTNLSFLIISAVKCSSGPKHFPKWEIKCDTANADTTDYCASLLCIWYIPVSMH